MGVAGGKMEVYSEEEIARHNTAEDCWVVAHGKVYDATPFLSRHPGMGDMIVKKAGGDVSRDFDMHTTKQKAVWVQLLVGKVAPKASRWYKCECQAVATKDGLAPADGTTPNPAAAA